MTAKRRAPVAVARTGQVAKGLHMHAFLGGTVVTRTAYCPRTEQPTVVIEITATLVETGYLIFPQLDTTKHRKVCMHLPSFLSCGMLCMYDELQARMQAAIRRLIHPCAVLTTIGMSVANLQGFATVTSNRSTGQYGAGYLRITSGKRLPPTSHLIIVFGLPSRPTAG